MEKEKDSITTFSSNSETEEFYDDEKPAISSEELQVEFERLKKSTKEKLIKTGECLLLKKLNILRIFNEVNLNTAVPTSSSSVSTTCNESRKSSSSGSTSLSHTNSNSNNDTNSLNKKHLVVCTGNTSVLKKKYHLLVNEEIVLQWSDSKVLLKTRTIEGEFLITNFRIIFNPKNADFCFNEFILPEFFQVPYSYILTVTKRKDSNLTHKYTLKFQTRDRPSMTICFISKKDSEDSFKYINDSMHPKNLSSLFAFKYNKKYEITEFKANENGWTIYQPLLEYIRMGINLDTGDCKFRLYIQELHGQLCDSYPNFIYIHKKVSNEMMDKVAGFRSKKRFPALVWQSIFNSSSMWRSSQAKTGFIDKRSIQDELYFDMLSVETEKFHIYDARPYINAFANKMKGYGFENTDNYRNAQLTFCDIENIHGVRQAYSKMKIIAQLPLEGYENWLPDLHLTGWLQIIAKIIKSSINVASSLMENATVLVHCSDGWDRTAQLCSLSQVIIDPFYRTLNGLIVLIEKEWVSYGHQFATRCGHVVPKEEDQIAPIFIQWLDCLHQFVYQYPTLFEFNNDLLLFISFHVNSCLYGTFLMNTEKDIMDQSLKFKTVSIWTDVLANRTRFVNPSYEELKSNKTILTPSCAFYKLRLWEEHFLRWNPYYVMNNYEKLTSPYI